MRVASYVRNHCGKCGASLWLHGKLVWHPHFRAMPLFKARLSKADMDSLRKLQEALGFIEGEGTDRERPGNSALCRAIASAARDGSFAIAQNKETATITISLEK